MCTLITYICKNKSSNFYRTFHHFEQICLCALFISNYFSVVKVRSVFTAWSIFFLIWLRLIKICKYIPIWSWFWNPEIGTFLKLQPIFVKNLQCTLPPYWTKFNFSIFLVWFCHYFSNLFFALHYDWLNVRKNLNHLCFKVVNLFQKGFTL